MGPLDQARIRSRTFHTRRPHQARTTDPAEDNNRKAMSVASGARPGPLGFPGSSLSFDKARSPALVPWGLAAALGHKGPVRPGLVVTGKENCCCSFEASLQHFAPARQAAVL